MNLSTLEMALIGIVVSVLGYMMGRFDKRLTKVEDTVNKILIKNAKIEAQQKTTK